MMVLTFCSIELLTDINKLHFVGIVDDFALFLEFFVGDGAIFISYFAALDHQLLPAFEEGVKGD